MLGFIYAIIVIITTIVVNMESNGWTELALCFLLPICIVGLIAVCSLSGELNSNRKPYVPMDPEELMHMRLYSRRR